MKIEIVKTNELQLLVSLARETFLQTYEKFSKIEDLNTYFDQAMTLNAFYKEMIKDNVQYYFLKKEEEFIGYLKLVELETELRLQRIYLLKEWQGKGHGQLFMDKAIAVAKKQNKSSIILDVWSKNEKAIKFYERNGFEYVKKLEFMMGEELQIDYLYRKYI